MKGVPIVGYYDGTAIRIEESLQINQKVVVIPIESEESFEASAAGGLRKYADPSLVSQEKEAWRETVVRKHMGEALIL